MKRVKKLIAIAAIMSIVFGGVIPTALAGIAEPSPADGVAVETTAPSESASQEGATITGGCSVPTKDYLRDGLGNTDIAYFNTSSQISANWNFVVDSGCDIIKYKYRVVKIAGATPWKAVTDWTFINDPSQKQITANTASGLITPLEEGETYVIKVMAKNSAGWSTKYATDGQILDTTLPKMNYFALQQNKPYGGIINLEFSANDNNGSGIRYYRIYRNWSLLAQVSGTTNTYADVISGDNVNYIYYVTAEDFAGNISESSNQQSALVDDVAPGAPAISYWVGGGNIVIFWPQVAGASNYELYRNGVLIKTGSDTKYTDTGLAKGETYNYTAYALDAAGNKSLASNTLSIYLPKPTISSAATAGEIQGTSTDGTTGGEQISPSPSPTDEGEVKAEEETEGESETNWSLIIAIIIAAAIVIAGILYWWYAREDEEDEI